MPPTLARSLVCATVPCCTLCCAAGLRVSELTALTLDSLSQPRLESIHILGKGRRELPLWSETGTVLSEWLEVRPSVGNRYLFLNARGRALSRDGFGYRLDLHVAAAGRAVPSLAAKRVTPHVLRHSTAMTVLHATGDIRKVSLWLGHADTKTTELYLRASPAEKLEILAANTPPSIRPGKFPGGKGQPDAPTQREVTAGIMPSDPAGCPSGSASCGESLDISNYSTLLLYPAPKSEPANLPEHFPIDIRQASQR